MAKEFNNMYDEFMTKLKKAAPGEAGLWTLHDAFIAAKKANSRMPLEMWINTIHPFARMIFDKNETFFLSNKKLSEVTDKAEGKMNTMEQLTSVWTNDLSEKTRQAIWTYLQNLCILSYTAIGIDVGFDADKLTAVLATSAEFLPEDYGQLGQGPPIAAELKKRFSA